MKPSQVIVSGRQLTLDRIIGRGGEGDVYAISGDAGHAIKIYKPELRPLRCDKVTAMVREELFKRSSLAAFPVAVAQLNDGSFAGFLMKFMSGYSPIHELYAPGSRKHHFPQADYRFLVRAATNIARSFASVHAAGCVVGDINHSGIFVAKDATAALIDADSFQFTGLGRQHLCSVGVPEYTPPELQNKPLTGVIRTKDHDGFGLAIVMFQMLLMGRHPFVGTVRRGDIPPLHENIARFRYVYAENRDVGMDQPPGTPALSDFSPELAGLFEQAFSPAKMGRRPDAQTWVAALVRLENNLAQCSDNPLHYAPKDASQCAWCEMERRVGTFLFLPYLPAGRDLPSVADPGKAFDLEAVWIRISRVTIPKAEQLRPKLKLLQLSVTAAAETAQPIKGQSTSLIGVILLFAAGVLLLALPKAWMLSLLLCGWAALVFKDHQQVPQIDGSPFQKEYIDAQTQWFREFNSWRRRIGLDEAEALREQLEDAKRQYSGLQGEEKRQLDDYRSKRKDRQLYAFLEGFDLARASIKGIGQGKMAVLASFGFDTAADIDRTRLLSVPGFGDVLIGRLLEWRSKYAARFVYNASENDADRREVARIKSMLENKAGPLRSALVNGAQELESKVRRVNEFALIEDPILVKVHARVEQAKTDLNFLGLPVPAVSPPVHERRPLPHPSQHTSTGVGLGKQLSGGPLNVPPAPATPSGTQKLTCPRCNSPMQKRLARKGRNAGHYFWGCTRYPNCTGTRP